MINRHTEQWSQITGIKVSAWLSGEKISLRGTGTQWDLWLQRFWDLGSERYASPDLVLAIVTIQGGGCTRKYFGVPSPDSVIPCSGQETIKDYCCKLRHTWTTQFVYLQPILTCPCFLIISAVINVLPGRAMKYTKYLLGKILQSGGKTRDNCYNKRSLDSIEGKNFLTTDSNGVQ